MYALAYSTTPPLPSPIGPLPNTGMVECKAISVEIGIAAKLSLKGSRGVVFSMRVARSTWGLVACQPLQDAAASRVSEVVEARSTWHASIGEPSADWDWLKSTLSAR